MSIAVAPPVIAADLEPYVTADGSIIREWAGPGYSPTHSHEDTFFESEEPA